MVAITGVNIQTKVVIIEEKNKVISGKKRRGFSLVQDNLTLLNNRSASTSNGNNPTKALSMNRKENTKRVKKPLQRS